MKLYHYTHTKALKQILKDGKIKIATASAPRKTKPIAWVSAHEHFEPSALKGYVTYLEQRTLTFKEQFEGFGCVRIEILPHSNLHTWAKLYHSANYEDGTYRSLTDAGIDAGANPDDWYGSLKPIPAKYFIKVEMFDGNKWVEYKN
ncbi:hypothetical protein N9R06_03225 [Algibacter sp.]|nr:hypothetical protein [Algibacter sp.]